MGRGSSKAGGGGSIIVDPMQADEFFGREWNMALTSSEGTAVYDYADSGYMAVNQALWASGGDLNQISDTLTTDNEVNVKDEIRDLDNALSRATLKQNITVFRGDQGDIFGGMNADQINQNFKGRVFTNSGYSSSSISEKGVIGNNYLYRIQVPAGKGRGAFIRDNSPHFTEHEYLIKRDARYKVVRASTQNGQTVVDLRMLG